jgi:energy-converting hydrogenase Eha subunit A
MLSNIKIVIIMKISAEYLKGRIDSIITDNILYLPEETDLRVKVIFNKNIRFRYSIIKDGINRISLNTINKLKFLLVELMVDNYEYDILDINIIANENLAILFTVPQSMFTEDSLNILKQDYYKEVPEKYKKSLKDSADNFIKAFNDYTKDNNIELVKDTLKEREITLD